MVDEAVHVVVQSLYLQYVQIGGRVLPRLQRAQWAQLLPPAAHSHAQLAAASFAIAVAARTAASTSTTATARAFAARTATWCARHTAATTGSAVASKA